MRVRLICGAVAVGLLTVTGAAQAQSFGIGGRFSFVRADVDDVDTDSQRFTGGHIRAGMSPRSSFELSLDLRTDEDPTEAVRVRQFPIQASLLLYPVRSVISPYLLGGGGWYATRVELRSGGETTSSETTREFGWHAGFGGELKLGSHAGAHADYRYTFLDFGDDDEDEDEGGILTRFLPAHRGSMWTAGITIYF
jgi:opacity protein-like surface antigen